MIRHLGSSLTDVTYVFDEPTIGLHPHDIERMNDLLRQLRDKGNTVLVVEHEPEVIAVADHVVDLGPGAGTAGGQVVFEGPVAGLRASRTITGRHLDDRASLKKSVRTATGALKIRGATTHNLRNVNVDIPSGCWWWSPASPDRARARSSSARCRARTAWWRSTRGRSAARGAAIRPPTPDCSIRSAPPSPRPTA
jgi:ABC-type multidrug transport system ATPase subunit